MDAVSRRANVIVLDDGEFYIELGGTVGYLQRRCYVGVTSPDGYECVGALRQCPRSGSWMAAMDVPYIEATGAVRTLGPFGERLDAVVSLWAARHEAVCRHRDR